EILCHETDALLAEPGSPGDFADKLADYMDNPEKATAFVEKAYRKLEKTYEISRVSKKLLNALSSISAHAFPR
ncbi:MAG: glycosyltransferase, partial [Alphaproteobacteria bacterium]